MQHCDCRHYNAGARIAEVQCSSITPSPMAQLEDEVRRVAPMAFHGIFGMRAEFAWVRRCGTPVWTSN